MIRILVLVLVSVMVCGCATILSKSKYPVAIRSEPPDVSFKITDMLGREIFTGRTPTIVNLSSGAGYFKKAEYRIVLEKSGYLPTTRYLQADFDSYYLCNSCWGGSDFFIGFLVVDPITGAMWKLDSNVQAELLPVETESKLSILQYSRRGF